MDGTFAPKGDWEHGYTLLDKSVRRIALTSYGLCLRSQTETSKKRLLLKLVGDHPGGTAPMNHAIGFSRAIDFPRDGLPTQPLSAALKTLTIGFLLCNEHPRGRGL